MIIMKMLKELCGLIYLWKLHLFEIKIFIIVFNVFNVTFEAEECSLRLLSLVGYHRAQF